MHNENLWAPWRWSYIQQLGPHDPANAAAYQAHEQTGNRCFLCEAAAVQPGSQDAKDRLVLVLDHRGIVLLNRYPYTNGHLLIAPLEHRASLTDLSAAQRTGLMELTAWAQQLLEDAIHPQGFNIGVNIGRCAGAGLPGHLHVHIVPRWGGDTNFMQTVGHVRVIPQALDASFDSLYEMARRSTPDSEGD